MFFWRSDLPATSATAAVAPTTTRAAVPATTTAAATRAFFLRTGLVHRYRSAGNGLRVQRLDGRPRLIGIWHFHEGEAARTARFTIHNHTHLGHLSKLFEGLPQIVI